MDLSASEQALKSIGGLPDQEVPILRSLLLLGAYDISNADTVPYENHILQMHDALTQSLIHQPIREGDNVLTYRLNRLNDIILGQFGYMQDADGFNVIEHINLQRVVERRKGIPVALGVLYMELAERQGWQISGLNFPGHFLLSMINGPQRMIFDPYHGGMEMDAHLMRELLKKTVDPKAELNHNFYNPVSKREVVLRFYNNRKTRLITAEHYQEALDIAKRLLWIAPEEPRIFFDAGILSMKLGHLRDATDYFEQFVPLSTDKTSLAQAKELLSTLHRQLQ